jgi:MarR family transcriptional regulator for hemolysin
MERNSPTLGFLLYDVVRLLRKRIDKKARGSGLTSSQWQVLAYLAQYEGINQNGLAGILEVEPISLCRIVDRLQTLGLIERHPHPSDRRVWSLRLAPAARPKLTQARKLGDIVNGEALAGISDADRLRLLKTLQVVKSNLADASEKSAAGQRRASHG